MLMRKRWRFFCFLLVLIICLFSRIQSADGRTEDEQNNIDVYRRVSQGVVNITSVVMTRDFFLNPVPQEGAGSGAIVDSRGYILTNNHVIKDAQRLEVTLSNGSKKPAKLVGADPDSDLAVIKIEASKGELTAIPMGDSSELQVGQKVLAIGNPFGLGETLTTGIISSLGRSIRSESGVRIEDVIQTDASINPGNSGGPLLNSDGKIIGINTAIISPTGASVGIGFAIPINIAKRILPDLIARGYVSYPWIGASIYPLIPGMAKLLKLKVNRGAMIVEVVRGGPADQAGIKGADRSVQVGNYLLPVGGDVVVGFNRKKVESSDHLIRLIREHRPGDVVELKVLRRGSILNVKVKLGERPVR
ncbi:MAG: trypsin-like peptidase domain-containing protein [Deltaproteobacteria bacterium]|nr:trypsin-like peptidase domain-containing protein [Deltaproteobacteria bacterium]